MQSRHSGPADSPAKKSVLKQLRFSREYRAHDFAMDVGEAKLAPLVAVVDQILVSIKPQIRFVFVAMAFEAMPLQ